MGISTSLVSASDHQSAIESYVALLHSSGRYAILDLQWTAPGTSTATCQENLPDSDHPPAFWSSVATAFKGDLATLFDLFNEPNNIGTVSCAAGAPAGCQTAVAEDTAGNPAAADWRCAYVGTGCIPTRTVPSSVTGRSPRCRTT